MGFSTIDDGFWTDPEVLKLTPNLKLAFFWLISNPTRHYTGLYTLHKEVLSKETGLPPKNVGSLLDRLEKSGFIQQDKPLSLVWVVNMFKYQTGKATKLSPQQVGGLKKHLNATNLHHTKLVRQFCIKYAYLGVPQLGTDTPIDTPIKKPDTPIDTPYGIGTGDNQLNSANSLYIDKSSQSRELAERTNLGEEAPSPAAAAPRFTPRDLIALYNDINPHETKKPVLVTDKRLEKARVRLSVFPERDFWLTVFQNVKKSPFLRSANGNRWNGGRGADLDWLLLNDQNPAKVWEDKYDDSGRGPQGSGGGKPSPYASRTRTLEN